VSLTCLHREFAWVVIGANAGAGLWALGAHRWSALRRRGLWWATVAAELTIFVQVALGAALVGGQGREVSQFHAFYGFVGIVAVGILFSYRAQLAHRLYLLYGLGGLFLMGLAIRAFQIPARP
jgi:hypothetical protein